MKKLLLILLASVAINATAKPLIIYTSYPVGSGPDNFVRQVAEVLSKQINTPVLLENKPGGNGAVALNEFNRAGQDSNAILFTGFDVVPTIPLIHGKRDLIANLKILSPGFYTDLMLITSPSINNVNDLQRALNEHPSYGSWAIGSSSHLYGDQLARYFKVPADHIPYKDFNQWYIDVSNQQLAFSFGTIASGTALEQAGRIKFLAVAADRRDPKYPNIPTIDEFVGRRTGITGPLTGAVFYIHKDTNNTTEAQLRNAMIVVMRSTEMKQKAQQLNYSLWPANKDFNKALDENLIKYQDLIRQLNINLKQ